MNPYIVIFTGCFLLTVDMNSEDGVAATAVIVHVVGSNSSVLQTLLQHCHQIIKLPALNTEQVVHYEGSGSLVPSHRQVRSFGSRIQKVNYLIIVFKILVFVVKISPPTFSLYISKYEALMTKVASFFLASSCSNR